MNPPMPGQLLVMAKAPVPGQVKSRLCPPCTPRQAAELAAAALADTLAAVRATAARRRVLVLAGELCDPADGFDVVRQRGDGLGARLAAAFADTAKDGTPSFVVGGDTPQLAAPLLTAALHRLDSADAVLGLAVDGGFWGLGLQDVRHAEVLRDVPMSTPETGRLTLAALTARELRVAALPVLRDVDTIADAVAVGCQIPGSRFAAALARLSPQMISDQPRPAP